MRAYDLSRCLGEIDEDLIADAAAPTVIPKPQKHHRMIFAIGSIAACAALVGTGVMLTRVFTHPTPSEMSRDTLSYSENGAAESGVITGGTAGPVEPVYGTVSSGIYFVSNGQLSCRVLTHSADPAQTFALWKQLNQIGDDVRLIDVRIESELPDDLSDTAYSQMTDHQTHPLTCHLTVSKDLQNYFDSSDPSLLTESLEKTMLEGYETTVSHFRLHWEGE